MEKVIREHKIENVISAVGGASVADQVKLVNAIKAAGTVKVINVCYSRVCYLTSYNRQILSKLHVPTNEHYCPSSIYLVGVLLYAFPDI